MEKSNSETSQKQSSKDECDNLENDNQTEISELPTTSREENQGAQLLWHNMNDFKSLDFNSADEVRQAMKAVLTGHLVASEQSFLEDDPDNIRVYIRHKKPVESSDLSNKTAEARKAFHRQFQQNLYLQMNSTPKTITETVVNVCRTDLKRRGRPMKAGPSKKPKRQQKQRDCALYNGKLSNVVQFKRSCASESGSDTDSTLY